MDPQCPTLPPRPPDRHPPMRVATRAASAAAARVPTSPCSRNAVLPTWRGIYAVGSARGDGGESVARRGRVRLAGNGGRGVEQAGLRIGEVERMGWGWGCRSWAGLMRGRRQCSAYVGASAREPTRGRRGAFAQETHVMNAGRSGPGGRGDSGGVKRPSAPVCAALKVSGVRGRVRVVLRTLVWGCCSLSEMFGDVNGENRRRTGQPQSRASIGSRMAPTTTGPGAAWSS
jgi:hypothetical protein